jgi:hypothetical protein
MNTNERWDPMIEEPKRESIRVAGVEYRLGDRVRIWPLGDADILDIALKGKAATIASIEQDFEDQVYFALTIDEDPGRDLGAQGKPGHRFFFRPEEVELVYNDDNARSRS